MEFFRNGGGLVIINEQTYRITNNENHRTFRATHYETANYYNNVYEKSFLKIGGQNNCVEITYNKNTGDGELQWVNKMQGSCEKSDLAVIIRNKHVRMTELVSISLYFLKQVLCPQIRMLSFIDGSKVICGQSKNPNISLSYFYFFVHGKTWYEHKFNAVPLSIKENVFYSDLKQKINSQIRRHPELDASLFEKNRHGMRIRELYFESHTYHEFINLIKNESIITGIELCEYLLDWFEFFIKNHFGGIPEKWIIRFEDYSPSANISHVNVTACGRKKASKKQRVNPKKIMTFRYISESIHV